MAFEQFVFPFIALVHRPRDVALAARRLELCRAYLAADAAEAAPGRVPVAMAAGCVAAALARTLCEVRPRPSALLCGLCRDLMRFLAAEDRELRRAPALSRLCLTGRVKRMASQTKAPRSLAGPSLNLAVSRGASGLRRGFAWPRGAPLNRSRRLAWPRGASRGLAGPREAFRSLRRAVTTPRAASRGLAGRRLASLGLARASCGLVGFVGLRGAFTTPRAAELRLCVASRGLRWASQGSCELRARVALPF